MVTATLISTMVSFVGGLIMYLEGLDIVENTVKEISEAEVGAMVLRLNSTFATAYETSWAYHNMLTRWKGVRSPDELQAFLEIDQFARVVPSQNLYCAGMLVVPMENTVENASAMYQMVWWDPLSVGVPSGTRDYINAVYLPGQWRPCNPKDAGDLSKYRCVDGWRLNRTTGERLALAYSFSDPLVNNLRSDGRWQDQQKGWMHEDRTWWRAVDVWSSADDTPYSYGTFMRVVKYDPNLFLWGSGYKFLITTYIVFDPWEDYLRLQDAQSTLVATFLNEGLDSQALATNKGTRLMQHGCSRETTSSGKNPCLVTLHNVSRNIREGAMKMRHARENQFFKAEVDGEEYWMRRRTIHPMGALDEMPTPHLLWLRPVSSVEDKLNRSLFLFVGFVAAIFVFDLLILMIEIRKIAGPLKMLQSAMDPMDRMDLDESENRLDEGWQEEGIRVSEVAQLVARFRQSIAALKEYRKFLPQGVLVDEEDAMAMSGTMLQSDNSNSQTLCTQPAPQSPSEKCDVGCNDGHMSPSSESCPHTPVNPLASPRQRRHRDSDQSNEQAARPGRTNVLSLGEFRRKRCTLLLASYSLGEVSEFDSTSKNMSIMEKFVALALDAGADAGGITVLVGMSEAAMSVLLSWNALRPNPTHGVRACECAVQIKHQLSDAGISARVSVATGRVQVGNVGNATMRAQVVVGKAVAQLSVLASLSDEIAASPLCTPQVYEQARATVVARVVDCISTSPGEEMAIYQLLDSAGPGETPSMGSFVHGFAALRTGDTTAAQAHFREHLAAVGYDAQALRLFRLAQTLARSDAPDKELLRMRVAPWTGLQTDDAISLPDDLAEYAVVPVDADTPKAPAFINGARNTQRPAGLAGEAERLKDQIREAYAAAQEVRADTSCSQAVLPSVFKDARGREYHRSDKSLGRGAFGQVWLGMADDGSMVAVKSIRLRGAESARKDSVPVFAGLGDETTADANDGGWTCSGTVSPEASQQGGGGDWTVTSCGRPAASANPSTLPANDPAESSANSEFTTFSAPGQTMARRQVAEMIQEVALMISLRHENVVQFLGCAVDSFHVLIVMEYLPGGSLQGVLSQFGGRLPLPCVRRFTRDIISGLHFIHHTKPPIVHRDLKPANVLLTIEGQCKLADFGASAELKQAAKGGGEEGGDMPVGTPHYMPPEQTFGRATTASDIWSLGIVVCELCIGRVPWGDVGNPLAFMSRLGKDPSMVPTIPSTIDSDCHNLCVQCCVRDQRARPTTRKLLNHPFVLR